MEKNVSLIKGYLVVKISGLSCERFFNLCVNHNISFTQLAQKESSYTAIMKASDFFKLKRLVKKSHVHIRIMQKHGLPFFWKHHQKQKLLLTGWIWCCFFLFLLSMRIWKIEIHGNQEITRMQIMQYLSSQHISYGSLKNKIDCKQMADNLRNQFPLFTWVAVKKQGTMLEIDLQENTDKMELLDQKKTSSQTGSSLVSKYDGKIIDIITRSGIPQVKEGDLVKKGDILVSGLVPVTDDSGTFLKNIRVSADADILIELSDTYTDEFSRIVPQTIYTEERRKYPYLKLGKKWFSFWKPKQLSEDQEMLANETQLSICSDFYLPVTIGTATVRSYYTGMRFLSEESSRKRALVRLEKFIREKKEKGVQILKKNVRIETGMTSCRCICTYQAYASETQRIPTMQLEKNEEGTLS